MTDCAHLEALLARVPEGTTPKLRACMSIEGEFLGVYPDTGRAEFPVAVKPELMRQDLWAAYAALFSLAPDLADGLRTALATISDLTRERDALREALEPFARQGSGREKISVYGDASHELISTTVGDLRRARAALTGARP